MPRTMLTNENWTRLRFILLELNIYDKGNLRLTVEGVLYRMRVGCPWRDLPTYLASPIPSIRHLSIGFAAIS